MTDALTRTPPEAKGLRPTQPAGPGRNGTSGDWASAAGNRATTTLLNGSAPIGTADVASLQRAAGSRAVNKLVTVQRDTTALAVPAAEHVNVVKTVHELRRAIDQTDTEMKGSWFWGKTQVHPVKFDVVDRVLSNLAPSQVRAIEAEYLLETKHKLRDDLLGFSPNYLNQPVPSELNAAQRFRVAALLEGTALEPTGVSAAGVGAGAVPVTWINTGAIGSGTALTALPSIPDAKADGTAPDQLSDVQKVVRRNRAAADAAEIKILLDKNDDASRKQIMLMLRKSAADNSWVASFYKTYFGKELTSAVGALPEWWEQRARALIRGDWTVADAYAVVIVKGKVLDAMNDLVLEDDDGKVKAKVRALLDELEGILAGINREAAAGGIDSVKAMLAVQLPEAGEGGPTIDALLRDMLGPVEVAVIDAMAKGDPVEEAAARMTRLENSQGPQDRRHHVGDARASGPGRPGRPGRAAGAGLGAGQDHARPRAGPGPGDGHVRRGEDDRQPGPHLHRPVHHPLRRHGPGRHPPATPVRGDPRIVEHPRPQPRRPARSRRRHPQAGRGARVRDDEEGARPRRRHQHAEGAGPGPAPPGGRRVRRGGDQGRPAHPLRIGEGQGHDAGPVEHLHQRRCSTPRAGRRPSPTW